MSFLDEIKKGKALKKTPSMASTGGSSVGGSSLGGSSAGGGSDGGGMDLMAQIRAAKAAKDAAPPKKTVAPIAAPITPEPESSGGFNTHMLDMAAKTPSSAGSKTNDDSDDSGWSDDDDDGAAAAPAPPPAPKPPTPAADRPTSSPGW